MTSRPNWWAFITIAAGGGLDALAAELAKVLPWSTEQVLTWAGIVAIAAGILLQIQSSRRPSS